MIKIIAIKTDEGLFIQAPGDGYRTSSGLSNLYFDGEKPEQTFHEHWLKIASEPKTVEKRLPPKAINYRYELKDATMSTAMIPLALRRDDVADCPGLEWEWKKEYSHLESLYDLKYDEIPEGKETIEYTFNVVLEIAGIKEYTNFSYPIQRTEWSHEGLTVIVPSDAKHQILDRILFPEIVLPSKPCAFTSEQSYKIVRQHVKQNINLEAAKITSDYNFCFTVKKIILLNNPYETKSETLNARGKSYRNRRYRTNYISKREVEVFEMTFSPKSYAGYTPILGFRGKDQDDLKVVVDTYLSDLMRTINVPLTECPHCNGMGVG